MVERGVQENGMVERGVDFVAQDMFQWRVLVNTVLNIRGLQNEEDFVTG